MASKGSAVGPAGFKPCRFFQEGYCKLGTSCSNQHTDKPKSERKPCHYFLKGRCNRGRQCKFSHGNIDSRGANPVRPGPSSHNGQQEATHLFREWRYNIPMNLTAREPLGNSRLGEFWQQALQLIESEAGQVQEVVTLIAGEGGMIRVAETIGQEFELMSDQRLESVFNDHLMPFFRVMTHRNVTASAILHTKVMSIYNFIFGMGGHTAVDLFTAVVRHLSSLSLSSEDANETDVESNLGRIEVTLGVMSKVIEVNSTAKVTEGLVTAVEGLDTMLQNARTEALAVRWSSMFVCLDRVKQRLSQGQALGAHRDAGRINQDTRATFTVARERPGELSEDGPRHDNDSADINDISILPTVQELQCARAEYLPFSDPQEWHLEGLRGLIDRHFRLLREDTVGQLRDAASCEFDHLYSSRQTTLMKPKNHGLRTLTCPNTYIVDVDLDQRNGLVLVLAFDQPNELRARSLKQRREWWESSRRLSTDALVCLVSSDEMVIFLVITERGSDTFAERGDKQHYDLWSDPGQSYVSAKLAMAEDSRYLVDRLLHVHSAKLSLVPNPSRSVSNKCINLSCGPQERWYRSPA